MTSRLNPEDQRRVDEYLRAPSIKSSAGLSGRGCSLCWW